MLKLLVNQKCTLVSHHDVQPVKQSMCLLVWRGILIEKIKREIMSSMVLSFGLRLQIYNIKPVLKSVVLWSLKDADIYEAESV